MRGGPIVSFRKCLRVTTLAMGLLLILSGASPPSVPEVPPALVLLSMDGVRWDYPARNHLLAFEAMALGGWKAQRLIPPFPSLTFVSHATLATGVGPSRHGFREGGCQEHRHQDLSRRFRISADGFHRFGTDLADG